MGKKAFNETIDFGIRYLVAYQCTSSVCGRVCRVKGRVSNRFVLGCYVKCEVSSRNSLFPFRFLSTLEYLPLY